VNFRFVFCFVFVFVDMNFPEISDTVCFH
jgi:hypothetical protein